VQPNEIPGRRNPEESRLPARVNHKTFSNGSKHHRSCLAHASKFFLLLGASQLEKARSSASPIKIMTS
jgi:hypothetical protein